jgi:CRISPR-associated protein Csa1
MYFLSDVDKKKLLGSILPLARSTGVSEELRGWNWNNPPLKPAYDERIPMYSVCSKYCPTSRDVFLGRVLKVQPKMNERVLQGVALHRVVSTALNAFLDGQGVDFDLWYDKILKAAGIADQPNRIHDAASKVWSFTVASCNNEVQNRTSEQPHASKRDILATALPFLVEHKVTGELLGLSGLLSVDCYDYLRGVVFDLKFSQEERDWYRLAPTGYAMVLESVYEVPVDVGCAIYAWFQAGELRLRRDLFFINDDLRSWWVEERDEKIRMVAQRKEPSIASKCYEDCIYWEVCRGEAKS